MFNSVNFNAFFVVITQQFNINTSSTNFKNVCDYYKKKHIKTKYFKLAAKKKTKNKKTMKNDHHCMKNGGKNGNHKQLQLKL